MNLRLETAAISTLPLERGLPEGPGEGEIARFTKTIRDSNSAGRSVPQAGGIWGEIRRGFSMLQLLIPPSYCAQRFGPLSPRERVGVRGAIAD